MELSRYPSKLDDARKRIVESSGLLLDDALGVRLSSNGKEQKHRSRYLHYKGDCNSESQS